MKTFQYFIYLVVMLVLMNFVIAFCYRVITAPILTISINIILVMFGAYLQQHLERESIQKQNDKQKQNSFSSMVGALIMEIADNLSRAKALKKRVNEKTANLNRLDNVVGSYLLQHELLSYYFSEHHVMNLRIYIAVMDNLNRRLDILWKQLLSEEQISQETLSILNAQIDHFIKFALVLEINCQKFVNIYSVRFGPNDSGETLNRLKNINDLNIEELEKELKDIEQMTEDERSELELNYKKALEETH